MCICRIAFYHLSDSRIGESDQASAAGSQTHVLAGRAMDETTVQQNLAEQSTLGTAASLLEAGASIQALETFAGEAAIQS